MKFKYKACPFCGYMPVYNNIAVKCETKLCAIEGVWIVARRWNKRWIGTIDLTPNPDVEKFLEEKYKSQEKARECKMIFKGKKKGLHQ